MNNVRVPGYLVLDGVVNILASDQPSRCRLYKQSLCIPNSSAHATTGQFSSTIVPELTAMDALERWE